MPTVKPTPGSQRRRVTPNRVLLELDPAEVTVPQMPRGRPWTVEARRWWETAHHSAISAEWTPDDLLMVERLLHFIEDLAKLRRDASIPLDTKARLAIRLSAEMRLLEQALGLGPAARSRLRVEIERGEDAERRRAKTPPPGAPAGKLDDLAARREALRARIGAS